MCSRRRAWKQLVIAWLQLLLHKKCTSSSSPTLGYYLTVVASPLLSSNNPSWLFNDLITSPHVIIYFESTQQDFLMTKEQHLSMNVRKSYCDFTKTKAGGKFEKIWLFLITQICQNWLLIEMPDDHHHTFFCVNKSTFFSTVILWKLGHTHLFWPNSSRDWCKRKFPSDY